LKLQEKVKSVNPTTSQQKLDNLKEVPKIKAQYGPHLPQKKLTGKEEKLTQRWPKE